jgi:hypothetical protein
VITASHPEQLSVYRTTVRVRRGEGVMRLP